MERRSTFVAALLAIAVFQLIQLRGPQLQPIWQALAAAALGTLFSWGLSLLKPWRGRTRYLGG